MGVGCRIRRFRIRRGSGTSRFQPGFSCSPPLREHPTAIQVNFRLLYFDSHWATKDLGPLGSFWRSPNCSAWGSHSPQSAGQVGELACRTSLELNLLGPQNLRPTSTSAPGNIKRQVAALCTCQGCLWSATKQICLPCTYPRRFEAILRCKASVNSRVRKT